MKLIVGLGNPGPRYEGTRHNVGYAVVRRLAQQHGIPRPREQFHGEVVEASIGNHRALLLAPKTFMNRSGLSVRAVRDFYKLPHEDILIICDDFNLPLGKLRFRARGSAGGQKGLQDVITCLGTQEIPRLRIGIGPVPEGWDPADYVLGHFTAAEREQIEEALDRAAAGVVDWVAQGIVYCMDRYNAG